MITKILRVVGQTEPIYIQSKKTDSGQLAKCNIRLRALGGDYEDEFFCTMLGNKALCHYAEGSLVVATLRFSTHEASSGNFYQDITVQDIHSLELGIKY